MTAAEIEASQAAWRAWEAAGRPFPIPEVPEYLTLAELAARYGTYTAAGGQAVPVLPGHVRVIDFVCPGCGEPAGGYVEYGGVLVCSRLCGALVAPEHPRFSAAFKERAARAAAARARRRELEAELAALQEEEERAARAAAARELEAELAALQALQEES
jgi:hypothetical protein